jgi:hypothetical protein
MSSVAKVNAIINTQYFHQKKQTLSPYEINHQRRQNYRFKKSLS